MRQASAGLGEEAGQGGGHGAEQLRATVDVTLDALARALDASG
ncbi:hypothetical protein [Streptomyces sp. NPDC048565]